MEQELRELVQTTSRRRTAAIETRRQNCNETSVLDEYCKKKINLLLTRERRICDQKSPAKESCDFECYNYTLLICYAIKLFF